MINLIKMNFYRMLRSKFVYILLLITFGITLLITSLETDPAEQELNQQIMEEQGIGPNEADESVGIVIGGNISVGGSAEENSSLEEIYAGMIGSGFILLMTGIFVAVYSDEERKSGFLKNLTVGVKGKKYIFASKIPIVLLFCTAQMLVVLAAVRIGCNRMGEYAIGDVGNLIRYMVTEILLHTAYGLFIMACYEMCRSIVLDILIAVFGSLNLFGFIVSMLETQIGVLRSLTQIWGGRLELVQYFLVTRARDVAVSCQSYPFVPSIVIAIAGLILYGILGMIIYSKRDTL